MQPTQIPPEQQPGSQQPPIQEARQPQQNQAVPFASLPWHKKLRRILFPRLNELTPKYIALAAVGSLLVLFALLPLLGLLDNTATQFPEGARREFAANEPMEFGPYDVTVDTIEYDYVPYSIKNATDDWAYYKAPEGADRYFDRAAKYEYSDGQRFALLTITISTSARINYNGVTVAFSGAPSGVSGWTAGVMDMRLGTAVPLAIYNYGLDEDQNGAKYPAASQQNKYLNAPTYEQLQAGPQQVSLLYSVPDSTWRATQLVCDISVYTHVSRVVGTEGMDTKNYEFTKAL